MIAICKEKRIEFKRIIVFIYAIFLISNIHCQCITSVNAPTTINGINVTGTGTGFSIFTSPFSACGGTINLPSNSLHLGLSGAFSYTYTFSSPVNNLTLVTVGTGHVGTPASNENFIFTTNGGGTPTLNLGTNCFTSVAGNQILSGAFSGGSGGGFEVTVFNSSGPFTSLTISGNGGLFGSLMALCSNSPVFLGVEYENKEVVAEENYNSIRWTTSHERISSHFDVMRSFDGVNFETIDRKTGALNSSSFIDYESIDFEIINGITYYKLIQYDLDGAFEETEIMSVRRENGNKINLYPNPSTDLITIELKQKEISAIEIYSIHGKLMKQIQLDDIKHNQFTIDITDFDSGVYFAKFSSIVNLSSQNLIRFVKL